ncbi:MAG: thioredoxin [Bacteroidetes bacterium]|nr:thioredoxin [Bacteroidota bacterium]
MWITVIVFVVVLSVFIILVVLAKRRMSKIEAVPDSPKVKILTDQNFSNKTKSGIVLVDFWAAWCGPCKLMAPVLNDVAETVDGKATIAKLNVDDHRATATQFKIRSIPTMILFKNGKEVTRFTGVKSKDTILKEIERRLAY